MVPYDSQKHYDIVDRLRDEFLVDMRDRLSLMEDLPVAVLSSFSRGHAELRQLPPEVPVVSLDKNFESDITEVISGFGLA